MQAFLRTSASVTNSIIWYWLNHRGDNNVWDQSAHLTKLCLQLTASSGPWNGDERRAYGHRAAREWCWLWDT